MHRALTTRYEERVEILTTRVGMCRPLSQKNINNPKVLVFEYKAIWDTGASHSVITKRVVKELRLQPFRESKVYYAGGVAVVNTYLVDIVLGENIVIGDAMVTQAELHDDQVPEHQRFDMLIGMDVLGKGDFAISNYKNKTMVSFRVPSKGEIDFTKK